jgi:hypothetical protein
LGGHAGAREGRGRRTGEAGGQGGGRRRLGGGAHGKLVCSLLLQGASLYRGEGVHLTPPPRQPGGCGQGEEQGGGQLGWGQAEPP